jgi:hypothetical protein
MASSRRPNKKTERRTTLTAMARATQRSAESSRATPREREARISAPPSPTFYDRLPAPRHELPPPYDDASGFIDLDKLREAAMAEASLPSVPSVPSSPTPTSPMLYPTRTAPPVAATVPEAPLSQPSSAATGVVVGSLIAAAGLAASFFIVSHGIQWRDLGSVSGAKQQVVALRAEPPRSQAGAAAPAPKWVAPADTAASSTPAPAAANVRSAAAEPSEEGKSAPLAAAARDLGDIDSSDRLDANQRLRAKRARARRAKLRAEKTEGMASDTTPDPALAQALAKSADSNGAAAAAPAEEPAPARPAPVAAPAAPAGPPGLAAAIQKASGVTAADMAPAAPHAAAPREAPAAAAAPGGPVAGLPDSPSLGAVRAALAAQLGSAKACVADQQGASRASLTFGSDGKVKSVAVSGPAAGTAAEECIRGALQRATVAPFSRPTFVVGLPLRPSNGDGR